MATSIKVSGTARARVAVRDGAICAICEMIIRFAQLFIDVVKTSFGKFSVSPVKAERTGDLQLKQIRFFLDDLASSRVVCFSRRNRRLRRNIH